MKYNSNKCTPIPDHRIRIIITACPTRPNHHPTIYHILTKVLSQDIADPETFSLDVSWASNPPAHVPTLTFSPQLNGTFNLDWEAQLQASYTQNPTSSELTDHPFSSEIFQKWTVLAFFLPHFSHLSRTDEHSRNTLRNNQHCCSICCGTTYSKLFHAWENDVPVRRQ